MRRISGLSFECDYTWHAIPNLRAVEHVHMPADPEARAYHSFRREELLPFAYYPPQTPCALCYALPGAWGKLFQVASFRSELMSIPRNGASFTPGPWGRISPKLKDYTMFPQSPLCLAVSRSITPYMVFTAHAHGAHVVHARIRATHRAQARRSLRAFCHAHLGSPSSSWGTFCRGAP